MENREEWMWLTVYSLMWALLIQAAYDILKESLGISPGWAAFAVSIPLAVFLYWRQRKIPKRVSEKPLTE